MYKSSAKCYLLKFFSFSALAIDCLVYLTTDSVVTETVYQAVVQWEARTDVAGFPLMNYILEYRVQMDDGTTGDWVLVDNSISSDQTSYTITFPDAGTYSYRLTGVFPVIGMLVLGTSSVVLDPPTQGLLCFCVLLLLSLSSKPFKDVTGQLALVPEAALLLHSPCTVWLFIRLDAKTCPATTMVMLGNSICCFATKIAEPFLKYVVFS